MVKSSQCCLIIHKQKNNCRYIMNMSYISHPYCSWCCTFAFFSFVLLCSCRLSGHSCSRHCLRLCWWKFHSSYLCPVSKNNPGCYLLEWICVCVYKFIPLSVCAGEIKFIHLSVFQRSTAADVLRRLIYYQDFPPHHISNCHVMDFNFISSTKHRTNRCAER